MSRVKHLIREVHRRSLWQTLTIYLGASWAVLEVTDQIVARYLLPEWVYPVALILLLLGLPIVLATAFVRDEGREPSPAAEIRDPTLLVDLSEETVRATPGRAAKPIVQYLTWPRAIMGGALAFAALGLVSAVIVARGSARVTEASGEAGEAFVERAWIVLAEIEAPESEREVGLAAQTALSVDLQQSQYLNVLGRNQIIPVLRRMGLADTARMAETVALEIAQREGMAAVLVPAVARLGEDYVFSARVIQPESGEELIAVRTAARADRLLEGVETLSREVRRRLGEESAKVRQSRPLPEVTTSSLEALRKYALAKAALEVDLDRSRAAELATEATRLDATFAMAYRLASVALNALQRRAEAREFSQQAYERRDRLTDRERMHVEGIYHSQRYEIRRSVEVFDALLAQYPDDERALNNLAVQLGTLGDHERAYELYSQSSALDPYNQLVYSNLIGTSYYVEKWDVPDSIIAVAGERGIEGLAARWSHRHAAAMGDYDRADAICDSLPGATPNPTRLAAVRGFCGSLSAARGRIRQAIGLMEVGGQFYAEQRHYLDDPNMVIGLALVEQMRGRPAASRARLEAALDRFPTDEVIQFERMVYRTTMGIGAALLGHTDLQDRFAEKYPEPSGAAAWTVEYGEAMASAARSLADADPEGAIAALRQIDARGYELSGWLAHTEFMYGLAFDELAELDSAVAHFEQAIHPVNIAQGGSWGFALIQLPFVVRRLAELEEARGNTEAAIEHYRQLLELWSDPDPELRDQVTSAQRALARLAGSESSQ